MNGANCFICGKALTIDMTLIIITEGKHKFKSCCCSHEGSKELNDYIKEGDNNEDKS